jgi:peroxiredoxin
LNEADKIAKINSLNHELMQRAEAFIKANPEKMASVILINEFFRDNENPQSLERALGYLKGNALESPLAVDLKIYLEELKQSAEGAYIPYFQLTDLQNKTILSSDFKGKYLLISFLSAGDSESREVIKILKKEYEQLNKDSVKFMSVFIDSDIYPISTIKNDSIPWTTVAEKKSWASDIVKTFHVEFVPYNILITPDGKIKNRNISAIDISKSLKEEGKSN